jgi:tetratricopeptide (TPR) repeat protein
MSDPNSGRGRPVADVYQRAQALIDAGRTADARGLLTPKLGEDPNDVRALALVVNSLTGERTLVAAHRAIPAAETIVRLEPDSSHHWGRLAETYARAARHKEAQAAAEQSLRLDPGSASAMARIGFVAGMRQKASRRTLEIAQEAVRLRPNFLFAHFQVARVATIRKKYALAEAEYRQVIRLDPNAIDAPGNLALIRSYRGHTGEGAARVVELLATSPSDAFLNRLLTYFASRQLELIYRALWAISIAFLVLSGFALGTPWFAAAYPPRTAQLLMSLLAVVGAVVIVINLVSFGQEAGDRLRPFLIRAIRMRPRIVGIATATLTSMVALGAACFCALRVAFLLSIAAFVLVAAIELFTEIRWRFERFLRLRRAKRQAGV